MAPGSSSSAAAAATKGGKSGGGGGGGKKAQQQSAAKEGKQEGKQQGQGQGDGKGQEAAAAMTKGNVDERVRKLAASLLLREEEGFFRLASGMERLRQRPPPGHDKPSRHGPDSGALQEMRALLTQTSSWCAAMEQEASAALALFKRLQEEEEAKNGGGVQGGEEAGGFGGLSGVPTSSSSSALYAFQQQQLQQQMAALEAAEAAAVHKKTQAHAVSAPSSAGGAAASSSSVAGGEKDGGAGGKDGVGGGGKEQSVNWKRLAAAAATAKAAVLPHLDRAPEEGDQAAAKISATSAWALSSVVKFNMITDKVEVMDVEDAKRRTYVVDRGEVALLPREHRKEVLTKHYPKYARVFAQYPETTSFYPAMVVENNLKLPRSQKSVGGGGGKKGEEGGKEEWEYHALLWFDEDEDESGQPRLMKVPLRLVTAIPEAFQGEGLG